MAGKLTTLALIAAAALGLTLSGCGGSGPVPVKMKGPSDGKSLIGGGSSFVYPIMNRWTSDYHKTTKVQVNYQSLGSSGGVKQFSQKTLDFGATDAPMKDEQLAEVKDTVFHVPVVMGAVAVTYNIPELKTPLILSGPVVADIYLGKITKWNDAAIAALNAGVALPANDIVTVRRADGSGTTFIFTDFLGKTSPEWKDKIGVGNSPSWNENSIGGKGNEGVSAQVARSPYSIGYVELLYALEAKLPVASLVNAAGKPVAPSVESVTAAAADLTSVTEDLRLSITNAPGEAAYPVAGISWVVVRQKMDDDVKGQAVKDFLTYVLSDESQALANSMNYSRLPEKLLAPAREKVSQIQGTK